MKGPMSFTASIFYSQRTSSPYSSPERDDLHLGSGGDLSIISFFLCASRTAETSHDGIRL